MEQLSRPTQPRPPPLAQALRWLPALPGTLLAATIALAPFASASAGPIPTGWTSVGNAGSGTPNGVVTAPPVGGPGYQYVSTDNGGAGFGNETDGSTLTTSVFAAAAGDSLEFYFNYVTSDGSGFADYAWSPPD